MRDEGGSDVPAEIEEEDYVENNSQIENGNNGTQSERSSQEEVQDEVGEGENREDVGQLYEDEEPEAEGDYEKEDSAQEEDYQEEHQINDASEDEEMANAEDDVQEEAEIGNNKDEEQKKEAKSISNFDAKKKIEKAKVVKKKDRPKAKTEDG